MSEHQKPPVGIIMGSENDLSVMKDAGEVLEELKVGHKFGIKSAHRTPDAMRHYAMSAEQLGVKVIIAGAGGSAHLPGMVASYSRLPVIGVPVETRHPLRESSLWSMLDMPDGEPVLTVGINKARNAGLAAARILAINDPELAGLLSEYLRIKAKEVKAQDRRLGEDGLEVYLRQMRQTEIERKFG